MDNNGSVALTRKVILTSDRPVTKEDFIKKIGEITRNIVEFLKKNGCRKIAHIKFISTTDGEDYLQYSVQDISREPRIQGILRKTFEKIKLTLNIIEFGVDRDDMNSKIDNEIRNIQEYFSRLK
jgi:chemotaxis regulatin CheY-phosphate phosphatase CheZ